MGSSASRPISPADGAAPTAAAIGARSPWPLLLALAIGLAYGIILFGVPISSASRAFWLFPDGLQGNSLDSRTHVSGYWWFVLDHWRWPLLALENPNWPRPANGALFDFIPIIALLGKALHSLFGVTINLFPYWCVLAVALNAVALATLVRAIGQPSTLAAALAAGIGAMSPFIHFRFGHNALLAHFVFIFALAVYFSYSKMQIGNRRVAINLILLCFLSALIHLYIYVMTAAIAAAVLLDGVVARRMSVVWVLLILVAIIASAVFPLWAFGLFSGWNLAGVGGEIAKYSMNVLSPFWPQFSGLFRWTGSYWLTRGVIGGAAGQYDGFNYLGAGALLLIAIALVWNWRKLGSGLRQHWSLALVLLVLTIWALSQRIYLGHLLIAAYEVPDLLRDTVMAWFRGQGRFFWPVGWLLIALGIAGVFGALKSRALAGIAVVALVLQWIDLAPLRAMVGALIERPTPSALGSADFVATVASRIEKAGSVVVIPPIFCSSDEADFVAPKNVAAAEVQLLAARANARMPWVYLSRVPKPCGQPVPEEIVARGVIVELSDAKLGAYPIVLPPGKQCEPFQLGRICY